MNSAERRAYASGISAMTEALLKDVEAGGMLLDALHLADGDGACVGCLLKHLKFANSLARWEFAAGIQIAEHGKDDTP